jgi:transposase
MKLRHRVVTKEKYDGLETSEVSSEVDSDDGDNWVARNRKNRPKKRKKISNPALLNSSKKKCTSEEVENA